MSGQPLIRDELGTGRVELFPLPTTEDFLFGLLDDIFRNHWEKIVFGTLIQGAVFEIRVADAPRRISLHDGYLTVDFGFWHFHLCIGFHKGPVKFPTPADLAEHCRTGRAELYRLLNDDGSARSWGMRLFNGAGEQQITIFLPNPFHADDRMLKQPDWSRLTLWDDLRARYLGLPPDPLDRAGRGFSCVG